MINKQLLKAKFVERNISKEEAAEKIGISYTALNYKINGKRQFKLNEIQILCDILQIDDKDKYFFAENVNK